MDWIDWGDAPAWAGTAIALAAMVYTIIKARGAKESGEVAERQAKAAESSAEAAGQSVGAAERAATAAEDQASAARRAVEAAVAQAAEARRANELAQEALEHERTERHEAAGPEFTLAPDRRNGLVHPVQVTMTAGGPYEAEVQVDWVATGGDWLNPEDNTVGGLNTENRGPHVMTRGSSFVLNVQAREQHEQYEVIVYFKCVKIVSADQQPRTWDRSAAATLKPPGKVGVLR